MLVRAKETVFIADQFLNHGELEYIKPITKNELDFKLEMEGVPLLALQLPVEELGVIDATQEIVMPGQFIIHRGKSFVVVDYDTFHDTFEIMP